MLTNNLRLLPRREAVEAALKGARKRDKGPEPLRGGAKALTYFSKFRGLGPNFL